MVLKEDQEELRALLVGAIPMLCKERLNFSHNFRVDAVIGVTIDNKEHFYISLNDSIQLGSETLASAKMKQTSIAPSSPTLEMCVESKDGFGDFDDKDVVIKTELDISDEFAEIGENISESIGALNSQEGTSSSLDSPNKPKRGRKRRSKATGSTPAKKLTLLKDVKANSTTRTSTVTSEGDVSANEPESMRDVADGGQEDRVEDGDRGDAWSSDGHDDTKTDVQQHEQMDEIFELSITEGSVLGSSTRMETTKRANVKPKQRRKCKDCDFMTTNSSTMTRHRRMYHTGPLLCDECPKQFLSKYELSQHMMRHKDGKLICDKCPKAFSSQSGLYIHNRKIHAKKYKYSCFFCGQGFVQKTHYSRHMSRHHDLASSRMNQPHDFTSNQINQPHDITSNQMNQSHHVTPYQCSNCKKFFSAKSGLKQHMISCGVSERNYQCDQCAKCYKRKSNLTEHMNFAHRTDINRCSCGKSYKWPKSLKHHEKKCQIHQANQNTG